ncbi:MAG: adenosylcobinamide-GDP ribazoletransferase [Clostridiales bacterium]|jgi:adenosylcobinamide-GDP ribazoletransferase|nr:adenosylcobinamide-GDP ribazoletransferase [Clostridiales bacterium]
MARNLIQAMFISFSTYSAIPVPNFVWNEENLRFHICFLPAVGLVEGALLCLWKLLCGYLGAGSVFFAAGAAILPFLVTGGIHMDGFCDTVDALSSNQDRAAMLTILKDPHAGAFAVIFAGIYMLAVFGLYTEITEMRGIFLMAAGFVLSRSVTAISIVTLRKARSNGLLVATTKDARQKAVAISMSILTALCAAAMVWIDPMPGLLCLICVAVAFFRYRAFVYHKLNGVTGDTTGFWIQICELLIMICIFTGGFLPYVK